MPDADETLIQRTLRGDRAAFGDLVRRYQDRLYNTVYRLTDQPDDALDVLQEAFLNAYGSLDRFKGDSKFFTWLYRIAVNVAISHRRKRRDSLSRDGVEGMSATEPSDQSFDHRPGDRIERREEEQQLHCALNRLNPDFRAVLVLRDIDGQKYEEIAAVLDLPIGTVRSRIHRARLELRVLLTPQDATATIPLKA